MGNRYGNTILGGRGDDVIRGREANDVFFPHLGDDRVVGGEGNADWVWFFFRTKGLVANLSQGRARGEGRDVLNEVEAVSGSEEDDTIIGDASDNGLFGWGGGDTIRGRAGDDILDGDGGTDTLAGGPGQDSCNSGEDNSGRE